VGQEISDEKIASLQVADAGEATYQKALHFLSFRPRSIQEVRQNLTKRGSDQILIEETINRLQQAGLVNDDEFARAWVENRNAFRPRSKSALRMELRSKGLGDETIQSVLDEIKDEQGLALDAARRQAHHYADMGRPEFRQKLAGFLARRGFSYSTLAPVISEVWDELQAVETGRNSEPEEEK